jgi:predicted MFS family arabinose efflux permease
MIGTAGAALAAFAIFRGSFPLFCLGTALLGANTGFAAYYRFAAAEAADPAFRSKAISLVLGGGVASALFGPEIAKWSRGLFDPVLFAGCYVLICGFGLIAITVIQLIAIPPTAAAREAAARPLLAIMRQPSFMLAAGAGMIAYGTMSLLMTATPLAMIACDLRFEDAAFVIQFHALGMYAPSFVTGHIIARFGAVRVMFAGVALFVVCAVTALSGVALSYFWASLLLLGVGWNFLYVGSTTLLTSTYASAERGKTQAANDFLIFGTVAVSSFSSGVLLNHVGWSALAAVVLGLAALILALLLIHQRSSRAAAAESLARS